MMSTLALVLTVFCFFAVVNSQPSVTVSDSKGYFFPFGLPSTFPEEINDCINPTGFPLIGASDTIVFTYSGGGSGATAVGAASQVGIGGGTTTCIGLVCTTTGGTLDILVTFTSTDYETLHLQSSAYPCTVVHGDPQFTGFRGQSYQIHGIDGWYYNLITSPSLQVNAKFTFLTEGKCPIINGLPAANCWSHPGSYIGALGFQQIENGVNQRLLIDAGSAKQGFSGVKFNNAQVKLGQSMSVGSFSFNFTSSHFISVQTGDFTFTVDNSDLFLNQAVSVNVPLSRLTSHGLLGQTHTSKVYSNQWKYIEGDVDNYAVSDLFASDFVYNQFKV